MHVRILPPPAEPRRHFRRRLAPAWRGNMVVARSQFFDVRSGVERLVDLFCESTRQSVVAPAADAMAVDGDRFDDREDLASRHQPQLAEPAAGDPRQEAGAGPLDAEGAEGA